MCARKGSFKQSVKPEPKKEYFNSKYSFTKVTGMKKIGDVSYILLLKPEDTFEEFYHKVKAKVYGRLGFKSVFDSNILCKRYDDEGNKLEEMPLCCHYADILFKELKEKARKEAVEKGLDPDVKENVKFNSPMTFTSAQMYIPIIVLGTVETELGVKPQLSKLAIKNGRAMFAYLEMNKKSYIKNIYNKLKTEVINSGEIDEDVKGEELEELILGKLKNRIIKVEAVTPEGKVDYEKEYSFISFSNENIGKKSGEREDIINFTDNEELMDRAQDFLDLFEIEVDKFVKDWTDEELTRYLIEDEQRLENIKQCQDDDSKEEEHEEPEKEEITLKEDNKPVKEVINSTPIAQVSMIDVTEEDISFDTSDDFVDDEWDDN